MTLYELSDQLRILQEMAEDPEVSPDALVDTMDAVEGEFEDKADGYAKVMRELKGRSDMLAEEIGRLQARKKACDTNRERIAERLQEAMAFTGKTKFQTDLFAYSLRKTPGALKVTDYDKVSPEYLIPQPPKIDTAGIRAAMKSGTVYDWCHLESRQVLSIR